jgi:hypothetical protein
LQKRCGKDKGGKKKMNKGLVAIVMMAVMAMPALAGSIGGASYFDSFNILGWGTWRTLEDGSAVIDADTLQGQTANDFYDYVNLEVALEATQRGDADAGLTLAIASEEAARVAGDASTLAASEDYTDALESNIESGAVVAAHSNYADWSWFSLVSGYAFQAGNADTLDGWDASDFTRYTRQQVRSERNRAVAAETGLQNQLDDHEERITALEASDIDQGNAIGGLTSAVAELREDVDKVMGDSYEYAAIHNYNEYPEKCGLFVLPRLTNEAEVQSFDDTYQVVSDDLTRQTLEKAVGMTLGADENTGLTKRVCFDQIPSAFSGSDYDGDGAISKSENNVWCVAYPAFAAERAKYPCEIDYKFSAANWQEDWVIYKEAAGEPVLLHVTQDDYDAYAREQVRATATEPAELDAERMKCLLTKGTWTC